MKAALIPPIPDLSRFVDREAKYHLLLAQHLTNELGNPYHAYYANFYRIRRTQLGDYLTLDNGAKEGRALPIWRLLELAACVGGAQEIVLPDAVRDCQNTIMQTGGALAWLRSLNGREAYRRAGEPQLMLVPQGLTVAEWKRCLLQLSHHWWRTFPDRHFSIGVAYHHDHTLPEGIEPLLDFIDADNQTPEVHLLGWPRRLETLHEVALRYALRSVDSSRPFVYAKAGQLCGQGPYPGRDVEYFTDSIVSDYHDIVMKNILMFRNFANGAAVPVDRLRA